MSVNETVDREHFLSNLTRINGKRLFPDFPEGPKSLKGFRIKQIEDGYVIYVHHAFLLHVVITTIHSIGKEGFIVRLDSLYPSYKGYLESILGKKIVCRHQQYYLEGKEYPLKQGQQYRYDEKTRNYYLCGEEPVIEKKVWNYSIKRKVDRFLKDLQQAQRFYVQLLPRSIVLNLKGMAYDDLHELYDLYLKHGKEVLADPNIVTLNIASWGAEIYKDFGALTIVNKRADL
jgi:hypothetical protein